MSYEMGIPEAYQKPEPPAAYRKVPNHRNPRNMEPIHPGDLPRKVVENMPENRLISRNSSCPCSSGKRYKRCCGKGDK